MSFATNAFLIDHFMRERDAAAAEGHKGHVIHNNRMAKIIKALPRDLQSLADLDGIKGVGPKARETIAALLEQRDADSAVVPATPPTSKPQTPSAPKAASSAESDANEQPPPLKRRRVRFARALFRDDNRPRVPVEGGSESDDGESESLPHATPSSQPVQSPLDFSAGTVQPAVPLPSLLLAHVFDSGKHDPTNWLWSEKLDGMRAFWCGRALWSRKGNFISAPQWFLDALPANLPLDGELYAGRGRFQDTVSAVRKHVPIDDEWRQIGFYVFDTPDGGACAFEERIEKVRAAIDRHNPVARVVEHGVCQSSEHAVELVEQIVALGGEGIMLRQPQSRYEGKRSKTLLKVKKSYDAEARVETHEKGKGRNSERLGALHCRMACGKAFKVGSGLTDAMRENPPPIGSIITYRFNELTRDGVPRFPTFVHVSERTEPADCVF